MARFRVCRSCGDLHQTNRWPHNCMPPAPQRSDYPSPYVQSDYLGGINGLYHHAALKRFDSKAAFRQATKETGCVEMGNELSASMKGRDYELKSDVIESGINDALHEMGISSDSDVGEFTHGG